MSISVVLIVLVFVFFVAVLILNKIPALIALPLMSLALAIVGRVPFKELPQIVENGVLVLRGAYVPIIIASIFGEVIKKTGIAENIIRRCVELAGDNAVVVGLVCLVVTTFCFMGLYGTGAMIMIGLIVLPIMLSVGVPRVVAGGILLMGTFLGYAFNAARWAFFESLFNINNVAMVSLQEVASLMWKFMIPAGIIAVFFVIFGTLKKPKVLSWETEATKDMQNKTDYERVPLISLISPIVPVVFILALKIQQASLALFVGIAFAVITTQYKKFFKGGFKLITSAAYDGFQGVALTVILMFGIGILVTAAQRPELSESMTVIINAITPTSLIGFVIVFGIIGPLLTQYRGPMSPWGLGTALIKILATATPLNIPLLLLTTIGYDYVVGVTDATSSQVVWTAGAVDSTPVKMQIGTIPYTWACAFAAVIMGLAMFPLFR
jgi:H+/gluconate symporter-like permease